MIKRSTATVLVTLNIIAKELIAGRDFSVDFNN